MYNNKHVCFLLIIFFVFFFFSYRTLLTKCSIFYGLFSNNNNARNQRQFTRWMNEYNIVFYFCISWRLSTFDMNSTKKKKNIQYRNQDKTLSSTYVRCTSFVLMYLHGYATHTHIWGHIGARVYALMMVLSFSSKFFFSSIILLISSWLMRPRRIFVKVKEEKNWKKNKSIQWKR